LFREIKTEGGEGKERPEFWKGERNCLGKPWGRRKKRPGGEVEIPDRKRYFSSMGLGKEGEETFEMTQSTRIKQMGKKKAAQLQGKAE